MFNKNLNKTQIEVIINKLRKSGFYVCSAHSTIIPILNDFNIPVLSGSIKKLIALVASVDCLVTVDTAAMHIGGGLGKHMTTIFTFTDGKVYTKYYPNCVLVQKHRDNGDWDCGPCYNWAICPKVKGHPKPCLNEITSQMLINGIDVMIRNMETNL
jgi:ADP-heptose:LPS heptosyltransferase